MCNNLVAQGHFSLVYSLRILDSFLAKHSFLKTLQIMEQQEITQNLKVMTLQKCGCPLKH